VVVGLTFTLQKLKIMTEKLSKPGEFLGTNEVHLGLTTRCNLACPFCARTTEKNRWFGKGNIDLDITHYKSFIALSKIETILLCGNYGDPIFYPHLFELLEYAKLHDIIIKMHTNGSGHNITWWKKLAEILTKKDRIFFSIDGIESNFTTYRIGAKWDKILENINIINTVTNHPRLVWKYILFKYNEDTILDAVNIAKNLGMDSVMLQRPWVPKNKEGIEHLPGMSNYKQKDWMPSFNPKEFIINNKLISNNIYKLEEDALYIKVSS